MIKRYGIFLIGLTFMSLGIVLIIKSALGTSPISSVPYVLSLALPFTKCERKAPKFIYGDISSLKNNDSISLFFIVLYF